MNSQDREIKREQPPRSLLLFDQSTHTVHSLKVQKKPSFTRKDANELLMQNPEKKHVFLRMIPALPPGDFLKSIVLGGEHLMKGDLLGFPKLAPIVWICASEEFALCLANHVESLGIKCKCVFDDVDTLMRDCVVVATTASAFRKSSRRDIARVVVQFDVTSFSQVREIVEKVAVDDMPGEVVLCEYLSGSRDALSVSPGSCLWNATLEAPPSWRCNFSCSMCRDRMDKGLTDVTEEALDLLQCAKWVNREIIGRDVQLNGSPGEWESLVAMFLSGWGKGSPKWVQQYQISPKRSHSMKFWSALATLLDARHLGLFAALAKDGVPPELSARGNAFMAHSVDRFILPRIRVSLDAGGLGECLRLENPVPKKFFSEREMFLRQHLVDFRRDVARKEGKEIFEAISQTCFDAVCRTRPCTERRFRSCCPGVSESVAQEGAQLILRRCVELGLEGDRTDLCERDPIEPPAHVSAKEPSSSAMQSFALFVGEVRALECGVQCVEKSSTPLSIEEIAAVRSLQPGTVEGHIASVVNFGYPLQSSELARVRVDEGFMKRVEVVVDHCQSEMRMKPLLECMSGSTTYQQLRFALAQRSAVTKKT